MKNKIRVFEAFAGYGSQSMALRRLGIDFEVVGISEIDKYAIQAYMAVHGDTPNYGDISKIDWSSVPDFDLFTYSFPCQDISSAGFQKGLEEGSGTRSSLLWECRKAIEVKKPKYLLMENVKALTQKKFRPYLKKWMDYLEEIGYSNFIKVLNAKDFGVPQNRERVFLVSIYGNKSFYVFPQPFNLKKKLKDILEDEVDEKYYLAKKTIDFFLKHNSQHKEKKTGFIWKPKTENEIANCLRGNSYLCPTDNSILQYGNSRVQSLVESGKINPEHITFIDAYNQKTNEDIFGTIRTTINTSCLHFMTEPKSSDKSNIDKSYRIRKLTPRETFRLMGVSEEDIDKIQESGISNTQQYKLAGNSIVVDVLYYIFKNLFINEIQNKAQ